MRWEGTTLYSNYKDAIPTRCMTVARKSSPNIGRKFWGCRRYNPQTPLRACSLFLWDDDVQKARCEDWDSQPVRVSSMTTELRRLRIEVDEASLSADADADADDGINAESDEEEPVAKRKSATATATAAGARDHRGRVHGHGCSERDCGGGGYASEGSVLSTDVEAEMARLADQAAAGIKRSRSDTDGREDDGCGSQGTGSAVTSGKKRKVVATAATGRARSPESPAVVRRSARPRRAPTAGSGTSSIVFGAATTPRKRTALSAAAAATASSGLLTPQNTRIEPRQSKRDAIASVEPESPTRRRSSGHTNAHANANVTIHNRRISDFFQPTKPPQDPQLGMASREKGGKHHGAAIVIGPADVDTPMAEAVGAHTSMANDRTAFCKPPAASTRSKTSAATGSRSAFSKSTSFSSTATTVNPNPSIIGPGPGGVTSAPTPNTSFNTSFNTNVNTSFSKPSFASTFGSFAKDSKDQTLVEQVMLHVARQPIDCDSLKRILQEHSLEHRRVRAGRDSTRASLKLAKAGMNMLSNKVADLERENQALKTENLALKDNLSRARKHAWLR